MTERDTLQERLTLLLKDYKPSPEAIQLINSTPIVLLVGVSGAGKDTIKHRLLETGEYHHIVSHTTRPMRSNGGVMEQDGVEYYFIGKDQAASMLERGEYVEANEYSGNIYGTSVAEIKKAHDEGKIAITDMEIQGVAEYKALDPKVIAVFVLPPTYKEWQRRLQARYGVQGADSADMQRRMNTAIAELQEALSKPYYHFVVNENLDEAVEATNSIAHHGDEFTMIDKSFRVWAEKLLKDLKAGQKIQE
jgi:guanylate kinase